MSGTNDKLAIVRRSFAKQMMAVAGIVDPRVEHAIASTAREDFLDGPPWHFQRFGVGPQTLASDDPVVLYQDVLFTLARGRGINNGSPSLHAAMLHHLDVSEGNSVVHLGVGSGYYTAMLATLAGPSGEVVAVEFDERLAAMARRNLAGFPTVRVEVGDGASFPRGKADRIYVNFAVSRPSDPWIEQLAPDGRLVLPLSVPAARKPSGTYVVAERGAAFVVRRTPFGFPVSWISTAFFIWAEGALSPGSDDQQTLREAFNRDTPEFVRSLHWKTPALPERCWFWSDDWSLSYDEVGASA